MSDLRAMRSTTKSSTLVWWDLFPSVSQRFPRLPFGQRLYSSRALLTLSPFERSFAGVNSFEFEAAAPSPSKIPPEDLLGVTVILLTASYRDQEFIRVGYYVNNAYESEELRENPPEKVDLTQVRREVLVSKPRVTRFNIKWDDSATASASTQQQGSAEGLTA